MAAATVVPGRLVAQAINRALALDWGLLQRRCWEADDRKRGGDPGRQVTVLSLNR